MPHSYEEIRTAVVEVLLAEAPSFERVEQWESLKNATARLLNRRAGIDQSPHGNERLAPQDAELARDVFWDLFRQGHVILGMNDTNPTWPWFRLSHFGKTALTGGDPYLFTDTSSYIDMVRREVGELDEVTELYLSEAIRAFYAGCLLSSSVMLGVAAEHRFLALIEKATASSAFAGEFQGVAEERTLLRKITRFQNRLASLQQRLSGDVREDLDIHLGFIQSVIRISRNESGHPSGKSVDRAQAYVRLQLFVPFAVKLRQLSQAVE